MSALICKKTAQNVGLVLVVVKNLRWLEPLRDGNHELENLRRIRLTIPSRVENQNLWIFFDTGDSFGGVILY